MADQGKWFKLYCGWDDDPHIDSLSEQDQLRWVKFGTYMKEHGTHGTITIISPSRTLQNKFRVASFDDVVSVLKRLPNLCVGEKQYSTVSDETNVTVSFSNWRKYQEDLSTHRVRKFRANETAKKRGEEKRREENKKRVFGVPTADQIEAYAKTIGFQLNGQKFCDYYAVRGWKLKGNQPMKDWEAAVRTWKTNQRVGMDENGKPDWQ